MADEQTCEMGSTQAPLAIGPYNDVWFRKTTKVWKSNSLCNVK
jgi:hypothetical protein